MLADQTKRPGRARRGWLLGLAAVVGLVAAAPTIVATTPVRDAAIGAFLPPEVGALTASGGAFGWTGPTALTGVELRDPAGAVVFTAERIEVGSSLLELAVGGAATVAVSVEQPVVYVELRGPEGSNLETLLANLRNSRKKMQPAGGAGGGRAGAASAKRQVAVTITGGQARVTDTVTGEKWLVDGVDATLNGLSSRDPMNTLTLTATGRVAEFLASGPAPGPEGSFDISVGPAQDGSRLAQGRLGSGPLSLAGAVLRRGDAGASAAGWMNIEGRASWRVADAGAAPATGPLRTLLSRGLATSGRATMTNPEYRGALTGGEPLRLASVEALWRLATDADRVRIEKLAVQSEIGVAHLTGAITPQELDAWLARRPQFPAALRAAGDIDLARLASVAPGVLRLRDGVRVTSGQVRAIVESSAAEGAPRLKGEFRTSSLEGVSGDRPIEWRQPLAVTFNAERMADAWRLEEVRCESEFLKIEAAGDAAMVEGRAEFDLNRLADELRQFVDLGAWRLAGAGSATAMWRRTDQAGAWRLEAGGGLNNLFVGARDRPLAREPQLDFDLAVDGSLADAGFARTGEASLRAGDDRLQVRLSPADAGGGRPLQMKLTGDAASWFRRARLASPRLPAPESLRLGGKIELEADGSVAPAEIAMRECRVVVDDLRIDTPGAAVREPRVEWRGDVARRPGSGEVRSAASELVASAVSLRSRDVRYTPGDATALRGEVAFRGDVGRIGAWVAQNGGGPRYQVGGALSGTASLGGVAEGLDVAANASAERLSLIRVTPDGARALVWSEPRVDFDLRALLQAIAEGPATRTAIELRDLKLTSETLAANAAGRVDDVAALGGVRLQGGVDYDLSKLSRLLWPKLGSHIRLVGRETAAFEFSSDPSADSLPTPDGAAPPRGLPALVARVEAPWSGGDAFGLPIGPGRLGATLSGGVVRTDPLQVAIGQGGRLSTQVAANLIASPRTVEVAPGPLATDVAISTEVSERVLKFIAPVLADATRIDGRFSMALSELIAPIDDPGAARAAGVLNIHAARVMAGPSIAEWVTLVQQVRGVVRDGVETGSAGGEPLLTINDKAVAFQMSERRVYHRGLEFNVGDAVVLSEGSVGVDETLDLLLSIPILDEWIQQRPVLLGGMRGQAVRIPVRGTLSRPKLDREAFRQLSRQLLESAAQGAIDQGLNLLLERLRSR